MAMTDPPPDWNDLRDVLLMAEAKSLSEAARRAGVSQSTMSRRLVAIEQGGLAVFSRDAAGALVPTALRAVRKGGVVVCAGIHMSDIPSFPYDILWGERVVRSVANLTRADGEAFLRLAPRAGVRTSTHCYRL
ncbi:MAG: LysR family transcriptional regulator, partial [Albidovulum sp.]|uniref:LysR family transcriptional regulator n=1 Tax=Albidovulum sp. TaxID=1872424 RepID=UPI0013249595